MTRVGRYVWDIDIDEMGMDELKALEELAQYKQAELRRREKLPEYNRKMLELIAEAEANDIHFNFTSETGWIETLSRHSVEAVT